MVKWKRLIGRMISQSDVKLWLEVQMGGTLYAAVFWKRFASFVNGLVQTGHYGNGGPVDVCMRYAVKYGCHSLWLATTDSSDGRSKVLCWLVKLEHVRLNMNILCKNRLKYYHEILVERQEYANRIGHRCRTWRRAKKERDYSKITNEMKLKRERERARWKTMFQNGN